MANSHLRQLCFSVLLFAVLPTSSVAAPWQVPPDLILDADRPANPGSDDVDRLEFAQTLFTDRKTSLTARSFREELQAGNSSRALAELSRLQSADPQLLVPMANGTWGPLFLNVLQDFSLMPSALQAKVIRESAGAAGRRLAEILAEQDFAKLPRFWLRYAGSEESLQALVLMSRIQIDRGQNRSAAIWLQVVAESGAPKYVTIAQQQLKRLEENESRNQKSVATTPDSDVAEQGEATDSVASDQDKSPFPEFASWAVRSSMSPILEAQIEAFRSLATKNSVNPSTPWRPAIAQQRVYQRTMRGLAAIDLESGETAWHYPITPVLDQQLLKDRSLSSLYARNRENSRTSLSFSALDQSQLANLFCRDEVQTRPVASNGRIFLVTTDSEATLPTANPRQLFGGPPLTNVPFRVGQLVALDAESGRRIWTVGRATLEQHLGSGDIGVWFYGPPCVTEQAVLSVFEWNGELRLGRFSVETGQYLSSAPISIPEQTIDKDPIRTLWACTPVRDGGLLWTTTTTGWLLCLDETTMSVMWASRLADESSLRSTMSVRRGRVAALTAQARLNERWNRSVLKLVGARMLVLSQEAYEAILIDSRSGARVKTIPVSKCLLVHADNEVFVLSDSDSMQCFDIQDGSQIWKRKLSDIAESDATLLGVTPTGRAAFHRGDLLLPLSDGHLAKLDLKSGAMKRGQTRLLPVNGLGSLASADDRLLYVSGEQVLHLSNTKPRKPAGEHLQRGRELLADGDAKAALREARQVAESAHDFRPAQNLIFQCLLQLAETNPETYLQQLQDIPKTQLQLAEQLSLEAELLISDDRLLKATSKLCDLLKMPAPILNVPSQSVPLKAAVGLPEASGVIVSSDEQIDLTIRTWALSELSELLNQVDIEAWPMEDLNSLPKALVSGISCAAYSKQLHDHVANCESRQLAFQLLQRAVQLKFDGGNAAGVDYAEEVALLDDLLTRVFLNDEVDLGVSPSVLKQLLSVAISEMPVPFVDAVRSGGTFEKWSLTWPEQLREQLFQSQRDWYQAWDSGDWSVVPIRSRYSYSESQALSGRVSIADQKDAFLNHYNWKIGAGSPGRLFSSDLIADQPSRWSLPLTEAIRFGSARPQWIYRSGTILLLRSSQLLTAVSVLDREVLWTIAVPPPSSSADNRPFEQFFAMSTSRPGTDSAPSWRIVSSQKGYVCLQERDECQALDLFSGNLIWKASLNQASFPVVSGPGNTLLFSQASRTPLLVDVATGKSRVATSLSHRQMGIIHSTESEIVVWDLLSKKSPRLLWIDPLVDEAIEDPTEDENASSQAVSHSVALKQFDHFQFLDASTLAAINASGNLRVVDLVSGEYQEYQVPFSKSEFPEDVRQPFLAASNHYLYVAFPAPSENVARFSSAGRKIDFQDELFVIDRQTGTVTAKITSDDAASLSFQDPRFPMILVTAQPNRASRRGPLKLRCFGVNGKKLRFDGRLPFDSLVRSLDYSVNRVRSFDVAVNGASFRIEADKPSTASDVDK